MKILESDEFVNDVDVMFSVAAGVSITYAVFFLAFYGIIFS